MSIFHLSLLPWPSLSIRADGRELNWFIPQHGLILAEVTKVPEPILLALLLEQPQPKSFLLCEYGLA